MPIRTVVDFIRTARVAALIAAFVFAAAPFAAAAAPEEDARPNIVLIMADDMGFSDLGCYGSEIQTPHLDRLAEQGMRFTQFYNNAKCTITRASLLTGLYPRNGGRGISQLLTDRMVTLGEVLGEAGYQTALSGKWHLGSGEGHRPIDRGFDEYYGLMDGCCNFFDPARQDPPFKRGITGDGYRVFGHNGRLITDFPDDYYTTDAFTDHAIHTLHRFAQRDNPFFLHVTYTAPHYPLHAKPADIARYQGEYMMGWEKLRERRYRRQVEMGLIDPQTSPLSGRDPEAYDWATADQEWEDLRMATYAAMVDSMDQNIGRLLDALEDAGVAENTIVMFLSDNGGCAEEPGGRDPSQQPGIEETYTAVGPAWGWAQNTPFRRYKQWVYEGGITTPLIVRYPGVAGPGTTTEQPGHVIDFMATFVELAETQYPSQFSGHEIIPMEGRSLVPILRGETRDGHEALYWHWAGNRAVREGKWKLVWDRTIEQWELYDLDADRTETDDLAADHPQRVERMAAMWMQWARETGVQK